MSSALMIPIAVILWEMAIATMTWAFARVYGCIMGFLDEIKKSKEEEVPKERYFVYRSKTGEWVEVPNIPIPKGEQNE